MPAAKLALDRDWNQLAIIMVKEAQGLECGKDSRCAGAKWDPEHVPEGYGALYDPRTKMITIGESGVRSVVELISALKHEDFHFVQHRAGRFGTTGSAQNLSEMEAHLNTILHGQAWGLSPERIQQEMFILSKYLTKILNDQDRTYINKAIDRDFKVLPKDAQPF